MNHGRALGVEGHLALSADSSLDANFKTCARSSDGSAGGGCGWRCAPRPGGDDASIGAAEFSRDDLRAREPVCPARAGRCAFCARPLAGRGDAARLGLPAPNVPAGRRPRPSGRARRRAHIIQIQARPGRRDEAHGRRRAGGPSRCAFADDDDATEAHARCAWRCFRARVSATAAGDGAPADVVARLKSAFGFARRLRALRGLGAETAGAGALRIEVSGTGRGRAFNMDASVAPSASSEAAAR